MVDKIRERPKDINKLCRAMMTEELLKSDRNSFAIGMYLRYSFYVFQKLLWNINCCLHAISYHRLLRTTTTLSLQAVQWADDSKSICLRNVRVNHGGLHIAVPEKFLHCRMS